jgi:hypothetical protein
MARVGCLGMDAVNGTVGQVKRSEVEAAAGYCSERLHGYGWLQIVLWGGRHGRRGCAVMLLVVMTGAVQMGGDVAGGLGQSCDARKSEE